MSEQNHDQVRQTVRESYGKIAAAGDNGCGCGCGPETETALVGNAIGYSADELASVPDGANLGLGCGNPHAIASLRPGEVVLDLGSGGGFDCLLAARTVGATGQVIGVDMTPEMVSRARHNADQAGLGNVEFRLGEIEHLPVADRSVDIVMSNCVINLSPDKSTVYGDAWRVLKSGGRLAIADIVATEPLPDAVRQDAALITSCIGGAATIAELQEMLSDIGFTAIQITPRFTLQETAPSDTLSADIAERVISATIEARKP